MRKFAKTLAVVSVLTPAGVNALGVGEIKLHSALNQKFLAEIPLLVSSGEDVSQIKVRLASPAAFSKAGLERPYYLANLRFKPVRKADGSVVIQVTSPNVIREPFLDFLLEVNWPQGRMLREFTVLLDPPVSFADEVAVVHSVPAVTPGPLQHSRSVATVETASPGVAYGPVKRNESLWKIAERLKRDASVTTEQMVMALYRENPEAFLDGNVNNLKQGVTLKIPSPQAVSRLSSSQARRELREQYRSWLATREESTPKTQRDEALAEADEPKLKLEAPEENEVDSGQVGMPIIEGPDEVSAQTREKIDSLRAENEALKARLEALEQKMSALLQMQNAQLAALQARQQPEAVETAGDDSATVAGGRPSTHSVTEAAVTAGDDLAPVMTERETTAKVAVQEQAGTRPQPEQSGKPESKSSQKAKPVQQRPPAVAEKETEPSFLTALLDEPMFLGMGGGSLLLLGIAGWMIWRRRQEAEVQADTLLAEMDGADQDASIQAAATTPMATAVTSTAGMEVAESSFLSEFTPSDFDILETENDAVDPIAEADVYLAYGRYQQAEELIKQALADEPEKPELRLKLLEIYYANEDGAQFEAYARDLREAGAQQDEEFWHKVVEMGREICPDSSLFGAASPEQNMDLATSAPLEDVDMDLPAGGDSSPPEASSAKDDGLADLDFDQFEFSATNEQGASDVAATQEKSTEEGADERSDADDHSLDFDLSGFDLEVGKTDDQPQASQTREDETLEFTSLSGEAVEDAAEQEDASGEAFDLTDMDEIDTKLDLARAYVDMEDVDAAREILDEILERGSGQQKREAQDLLDKLRLTS